MKNNDKRLHKLRYWREIVGLKQDDIAVILGCKGANYCQKETGRSDIGLKQMKLIQTAINSKLKKMGREELTLDDLFM